MSTAPSRSSGRSIFPSSSSSPPAVVVSTKLEGLQISCERLRVENREALLWSGLLDDFSAFNTSLRLLRDSIPANFNSLAVSPHEVPADLAVIGAIPDLLSTFPGNDAYELSEQLTNRLKEWGLVCDNRRTAASGTQRVTTGSTTTPAPSLSLLVPQDAQQLRLKVQQFNRGLDQAREVLQKVCSESKVAVAAASKSTTYTQPLQPKPAVLRKDYETLHAILTRIYRGTGLAPASIEDL